MGGDVLTGHFVRIGGTDHISEVHGDGHTSLRRVSATGVVSTSSSDSLVAHFRSATGGSGKGAGAISKGPRGGKDALNAQGEDRLLTRQSWGMW